MWRSIGEESVWMMGGKENDGLRAKQCSARLASLVGI